MTTTTELPSIYRVTGFYADHTVREGMVCDLGAFEGQMAYMPAAYQIYLEGFGLENDDDTVTVDFPAEWKIYAETHDCETVTFRVDDYGFIEEV
jgi:hypothetical protein